MKLKYLMLDLDGTLLPMDQEKFVKYYIPMLVQRFTKWGKDSKLVNDAIWAGVAAMVQNDGSDTNEEVFWRVFTQLLEIDRNELEEEMLDFYSDEFNQAIVSTDPSPVAETLVREAKRKGLDLYLATNPIFPRCATLNRIRWAGLQAEDFRGITTFENCSYSKPNPAYYEKILERYQLNPSEGMMIGNDVVEDQAAMDVGLSVYLVTDCLEHKEHEIKTPHTGSLEDALAFIQGLE